MIVKYFRYLYYGIFCTLYPLSLLDLGFGGGHRFNIAIAKKLSNRGSSIDYIITYNIYFQKLCSFLSAGHPEVAIKEVPSTCPYDCVKIIATVRSYPKHTSVVWKKGEKCIDITQPKYDGSSVVGNCPILCINNTKEEDGDVYTIEVQNEWGKGTSSEELFVIGGKIRYKGSSPGKE